MKKLGAFVLAAISLCIVLVGCGINDPAKGFIGTWEAVEVTEYGSTFGEEVLSTRKQNGYHYYLELNEDGTAELADGEMAYPGTWTFEEEEGKATFESGAMITATLELKDGQLVATYSHEQVDDPKNAIYKRIDPSEKSEVPSMEEYFNESEKGIENARIEGAIDSLTDATEMSVVAVDDDLCTIKALGKGNYEGSPSIILELTNKSDETMHFLSDDDWTVNGIVNNPNLDAPLRAGETVSVVMLFNPEEVGEDATALTDVNGKIMVLGPVDSEGLSKILATYDVAF